MKLRDGASGPSPPRSREITPSASLRPCPRPSLYEVVGVMRRYPSARGASSGPKSKRCVASSVVALSSVPAGPSPCSLTALTWTMCSVLSESPNTASPLSDRKSTRLNSSHVAISYAVFCLKKKHHKPRGDDRERIGQRARVGDLPGQAGRGCRLLRPQPHRVLLGLGAHGEVPRHGAQRGAA